MPPDQQPAAHETNGRWPHVAQVALMLVGGVACLFFGQAELGAALIGASIGNATPQNLIAVSKLPPFYRKDPQ